MQGRQIRLNHNQRIKMEDVITPSATLQCVDHQIVKQYQNLLDVTHLYAPTRLEPDLEQYHFYFHTCWTFVSKISLKMYCAIYVYFIHEFCPWAMQCSKDIKV